MRVVRDMSLPAVVAGFVAVLVGFTSSAVIVFAAARAAGATPEQAESLLYWMRAAPPEMLAVEIRERARSMRERIEAEMAQDRRRTALALGGLAVGVIVVLVILARRRAGSEDG